MKQKWLNLGIVSNYQPQEYGWFLCTMTFTTDPKTNARSFLYNLIMLKSTRPGGVISNGLLMFHFLDRARKFNDNSNTDYFCLASRLHPIPIESPKVLRAETLCFQARQNKTNKIQNRAFFSWLFNTASGNLVYSSLFLSNGWFEWRIW